MRGAARGGTGQWEERWGERRGGGEGGGGTVDGYLCHMHQGLHRCQTCGTSRCHRPWPPPNSQLGSGPAPPLWLSPGRSCCPRQMCPLLHCTFITSPPAFRSCMSGLLAIVRLFIRFTRCMCVVLIHMLYVRVISLAGWQKLVRFCLHFVQPLIDAERNPTTSVSAVTARLCE